MFFFSNFVLNKWKDFPAILNQKDLLDRSLDREADSYSFVKSRTGSSSTRGCVKHIEKKKEADKKKKKLTNSGDQCIKSVFTDKMTSKGIHKAYAKILQMSNH